MSRKQYLQRLLANHTRRLEKLREQQALAGYSTNPEILLEIEDIESEIQRLQQALAALKEADTAPDQEPQGFELLTQCIRSLVRLAGNSLATVGKLINLLKALKSNSYVRSIIKVLIKLINYLSVDNRS